MFIQEASQTAVEIRSQLKDIWHRYKALETTFDSPWYPFAQRFFIELEDGNCDILLFKAETWEKGYIKPSISQCLRMYLLDNKGVTSDYATDNKEQT